MVCLVKAEERSGLNRICCYDCQRSLAAITISSAQLCLLDEQRTALEQFGSLQCVRKTGPS